MLASWNYCKVHGIIYVPSTQPCPRCLQEENRRLKGIKMTPDQITQLRQILQKAKAVRQNGMTFNDKYTVEAGLAQICDCILEALALLPCPTCDGTKKRYVLDKRYTDPAYAPPEAITVTPCPDCKPRCGTFQCADNTGKELIVELEDLVDLKNAAREVAKKRIKEMYSQLQAENKDQARRIKELELAVCPLKGQLREARETALWVFEKRKLVAKIEKLEDMVLQLSDNPLSASIDEDVKPPEFDNQIEVKPVYFQCETCKGTKEVPERNYIARCGYNDCPGKIYNKEEAILKKTLWRRHWTFKCPVCDEVFVRERLIVWPGRMVPCPTCQ